MAYEIRCNSFKEPTVAGPFATRAEAEEAIHKIAANRKVKPQELGYWVRTTANHPRRPVREAIADLGIVEADAVKKIHASMKRPLKAKRHFPLIEAEAKRQGLDLVADLDQVSSPELTAWYVQRFCQLNSLKSA